MTSEKTTYRGIITGWHCSCRNDTSIFPLSQRVCPYCSKPMAPELKSRVYHEVLAELQQDSLDSSANRWKRYAKFSSGIQGSFRVFIVLLAALWLILLIILKPDVFPPLLVQLYTFFKQILEQILDLVTAFPPVFEKLKQIHIQPLLEAAWEILSTAFLWLQRLFARISDLISLITSYLS